VQGIRTRGGKFNDVAIGAALFVIAMLAMILVLFASPLPGRLVAESGLRPMTSPRTGHS